MMVRTEIINDSTKMKVSMWLFLPLWVRNFFLVKNQSINKVMNLLNFNPLDTISNLTILGWSGHKS